MSVLIALAVFGVLIAIHEAGHFFVARWAGMRVESFSIGFGPALASFQRGDTQYRVGLLPLGGYVRIAGMNPGEDSAPDDPRTFGKQPAWKRLLVIIAGALMNYLLAWVLLVVLLTWGAIVPDMASTRISAVDPGTPAAAAGLQPGDRILEVQGKEVHDFHSLADAIHARAGQPTDLLVGRGSAALRLSATPSEKGFIGVRPSETVEKVGLPEAVGRASLSLVTGSLAIVQSLVDLVRGHPQGDLMGPVGIAAVVAEQASRGARWLLSVVVNLSLALGFFNLLPIPALDGGRAAFLILELVRRRPVDARAEAIVHVVGFVVLLGLILLVTVGDVGRLLHR